MARKNSPSTLDRATLAADEHRADERRDAAADAAATAAGQRRGLLPTLAEYRAARDAIEPAELIAKAADAARMNLRGAAFSTDDRLEASATAVAAVMAASGGAMPHRDSPAVSLSRLGGYVNDWRSAVLAKREREHLASLAAQDAHAVDAGALDPAAPFSHVPAEYLAAGARQSLDAAREAAAKTCEFLGVPAATATGADHPAFIALYVWARGPGIAGEVLAAELDRTAGAYRVALAAGCKFLREFYGSPAGLLRRLAGGARQSDGYRVTAVHPNGQRAAVAPTRIGYRAARPAAGIAGVAAVQAGEWLLALDDHSRPARSDRAASMRKDERTSGPVSAVLTRRQPRTGADSPAACAKRRRMADAARGGALAARAASYRALAGYFASEARASGRKAPASVATAAVPIR